MKKIVITGFVLLLNVSICRSGVERFYKEDISYNFGVAYYQDQHDSDAAMYAQLTGDIGDYIKGVVLGFGMTVPLNEIERTRPHFSIGTSIEAITGNDVFMDVYLGSYICVSPYGAWGIQLGVKF
jgi:hypothetical protein